MSILPWQVLQGDFYIDIVAIDLDWIYSQILVRRRGESLASAYVEAGLMERTFDLVLLLITLRHEGMLVRANARGRIYLLANPIESQDQIADLHLYGLVGDDLIDPGDEMKRAGIRRHAGTL
jgi:hypothetical protein